MQSTNALGVKVVIITIGVIALAGGIGFGIRYLVKSMQKEEPVDISAYLQNPPQQNSETEAELQDSDADGLPDIIENIYRTDPNNPDSDGDGTSDGDEVQQQRDPALAGPNDTINVQPESLDPTSYTAQYFASLPEGVSQTDVANQENLTAFVEQHATPLPADLSTITITTSPNTGADAIQQYLETISPTHNEAVTAVSSADIEAARGDTDPQSGTEKLNTIIAQLQQNLTIFTETPVPAEATELHKKLIASTQALVENITLLKNTPQDFVGGLVGAKRIEELGPAFADIGTQIKNLETKYDLG